jgi:hypothetical protein
VAGFLVRKKWFEFMFDNRLSQKMAGFSRSAEGRLTHGMSKEKPECIWL